MSEKYQPVSTLLNNIKYDVENKFRYVYVQGELANWTRSAAGHYYFSLNDEQGSLSGALFKGDARLIKNLAKLKDGEKIFIEGKISVYTKRSSVQIIAKKIFLQNQRGSLKEQFEKIKTKLATEGLFDIDRKRSIPQFPKKIALITSPHGAAVQDFLKIIMRNSFKYHIVVVPAVVQGDNAESSLVEALEKAQSLEEMDVIVLTRGGGSLEDLWSFNGEQLARAISNCSVPTISAVGHEVNFSISDFVADLRCETPSAAAEILSAPQLQFHSRFKTIRDRFLQLSENLSKGIRLRLYQFNPNRVLGLLWDDLKERRKTLSQINANRILSAVQVHETTYYLDETFQKVIQFSQEKMKDSQKRMAVAKGMLESLNPKKVLNRGYLYLSRENNIIPSAKSFKKISAGEFDLHFFDGTVKITKAEK